MIYAYVTNETCKSIEAELPDAYIGRQETPVSEHGDYNAWEYDAAETRRMIHQGERAYERKAARAVAELLDWPVATHMTRNEMTFLGWGLVGEPQEDMIVQTGNGRGIDVTGYYEGDYWDGPNASDFKGPDPYGVVPVYEMPTGGVFPVGAKQYPHNA